MKLRTIGVVSIAGLIATLGALTPATAQNPTGDEPVIRMAGDDMQMNSAMGGAQVTLPAFLANATDEDGFGVQGAAVKVAFATSDGSEIIWVTPFAWDSDISLTGLLVNQPVDMG